MAPPHRMTSPARPAASSAHPGPAQPYPRPGPAAPSAHPGPAQPYRGPGLRLRLRAPAPAACAPAAAELHAHRAPALEKDLGDEGPALHGEVGPPHDRVQVGAGRRQPPAPADVPVERGEPLLAVTVHVLGQRVARLLRGLEEGAEQRVGRRAPLQDQRAVRAAVLVPARQAVLHLLEVRQAVRVVPAAHPGVGGPSLVVQRVPALEDHAVDAARSAEHLAPGVVDPPAPHERLGLGLVPPVVERLPMGNVSAAGM